MASRDPKNSVVLMKYYDLSHHSWFELVQAKKDSERQTQRTCDNKG